MSLSIAAYVDDTSGSSKGDSRLASVSFPNGQVTKYDYFNNQGDQRLQAIRNLKSGGQTISQFSYRYDPAGQIKRWQQLQGNSSLDYRLDYDAAGQLTDSVAGNGNSPRLLNQEHFAYDAAANRTSWQHSTVTRVRFGGTITSGNTWTITVKNAALTGGSEVVTITLAGGDTLATAALKMAAAISSNTGLQTIGVSAAPNGPTISILSAATEVTTYEGAVSSGATSSIAVRVTDNFVQNAVVTGTKTTGDVITLVVKDEGLIGGIKNIAYTVLSGDTLTSIATGIKNAVNADVDLQALGVAATSVGTSVTLRSASSTATTYDQSVSTGATASLAISINPNIVKHCAMLGTKTTGDVITLTAYDPALPSGSKAVSYTVLTGDSLATICSGLVLAVNSDSDLGAAAIKATATGSRFDLISNSLNKTEYRATTSAGATATATINIPTNGVQNIVVNGTATAGDSLTLYTHDAELSGGVKSITYTVQSGDNLEDIAQGLSSAINADLDLNAASISATSNQSAIFIASNSLSITSFSQTTNIGATASLFLGKSANISENSHNDLNETLQILPGGKVRVRGTANKTLKLATANSNSLQLSNSLTFKGDGPVTTNAANISVAVTDSTNTTRSEELELNTQGTSSTIPSHDANGNMTSNGINTYNWDAENRLVKITYQGTGNYSQFLYDGMSRNTIIIESTSGSATSIRQFIWDQPTDSNLVEERDGVGNKVNEFFDEGERPAGSDGFYSLDHLASSREMTDLNGFVNAQYEYGMFGAEKKTGLESAVFSFTGLFSHQRSQLFFAPGRPYSAALARWISRDPAGETEFFNLFCYVENDPVNYFDSTGYGKQKGDRSGGRAKGKGKNQGKINPDCKSITCCYDMYDRCRYRTAWHYFMHKSLGGYETDYNGSMRCCKERRNNCITAVSTGKSYPKSSFDCPNECLHPPQIRKF